jgi:hypothetical protein
MDYANLNTEQVLQVIPPAQYATEEESLYFLTGKNRFLCLGNISECADIHETKASTELNIEWRT